MGIQPIQAPTAQPTQITANASSRTSFGVSPASSLVSSKGTCSYLFDTVMFIPNMLITLVRKTISLVSCGYICADRKADPKEVKKALEAVVNADTDQARTEGFADLEKKFGAAYRGLLDERAVNIAAARYIDAEKRSECKDEQLRDFAEKAAKGDATFAKDLLEHMKANIAKNEVSESTE